MQVEPVASGAPVIGAAAGMRVDGVDERGAVRFSAVLAHGADPETMVHEHGCTLVRPLDARREPDATLALRLLVHPGTDRAAPPTPARGRDRNLVIADGVVPEVRQRFAAYAVVRSPWGLLATEYSARTAVDGRWGMPGGGLDDGEEPTDAVLREIHEETSQSVVLGELVGVQSAHWVGRSPRDTIEDFHAVRLIYLAECPDPGEPVVLDTGGTTESARWVPLDTWTEVAWTQNWRQALGELLTDDRD